MVADQVLKGMRMEKPKIWNEFHAKDSATAKCCTKLNIFGFLALFSV
jgi:hypothetical protein